MRLSVIVHPNARNERIEKDLLGTLHIYVNQPPLEGKANKATIEALAEYFKVSKSQISLISGATSKYKTFLIQQLY